MRAVLHGPPAPRSHGTTAQIDRLEKLGHTAYGPTIAGHGKGEDKAVDHDDCVASIVDFVKSEGLSDIVLLGHSFGGTVIARVAELIIRLIFWNAFVPEPGNRLLDELPPHYRTLFAQLAAESDDNTMTLPLPIWRDALIQDVDLDTATSTYQQLSS